MSGICPSVAPGRTCAIVAGDDTAGDFYCKIEAPASSKMLRGALMAVLGNGSIGATSDAR
ncbi:MAG TPA: hypothetical protein VKM54_27840 [Myxococcota bacterium]|nr:hypothetical protein [Myxococcota bacterium]